MALTRIPDGALLSIQETRTTPGTYTLGSYTSVDNDPPGGYLAGDLAMILVRSRGISDYPDNFGFLPPIGWLEIAHMPADIGLSSYQSSYILARTHDDTAGDYSDVEGIKSGPSAKQLNYSGHMFGYRGGVDWEVLDSGSLGPLSGGVTPAASVSLTLPPGKKGLIIAVAANAALSTIPTVDTANGFTSQYTNDDPDNSLTMPVRMMDFEFLTSGSYDLPRFGSMTQGSSPGEHHAFWTALAYGEEPIVNLQTSPQQAVLV